jgi:putative acetyltransferase
MPGIIERQTQRTTEMAEIIALSDAYLSSLYPAESNHLVDIGDLLSERYEFFLLRVSAATVGSVAIGLTGEYPEMKRMFVKEEYRGRGYGKLLIKFILDRCRELGHTKIQLETGINQPEAIGAYEKHGFRRIGPLGTYREDPLSVFYEIDLKLDAGDR